MKKELLLLPLALLFSPIPESGCTGPVDQSWNRNDFEPLAMSCQTEEGHIIYMRDGKEYLFTEDVDYLNLGIELKDGIMFHIKQDEMYRGFLYNPETGEATQQYCVQSQPFYYC